MPGPRRNCRSGEFIRGNREQASRWLHDARQSFGRIHGGIMLGSSRKRGRQDVAVAFSRCSGVTRGGILLLSLAFNFH